MRRFVIVLVIAWAVLAILLMPPEKPTYRDWMNEEMKWGLP